MKVRLFIFLVGTSFTLAAVFWKKEIKIDTTILKKNPEKRVAHTITYLDDITGTVLLDGYHRPDKTPLQGDVCVWDGKQWKIIQDNDPRVTLNSSAAYDSRKKKLVLFGGMLATGTDETRNMNDTWEWDGEKWSKLQ